MTALWTWGSSALLILNVVMMFCRECCARLPYAKSVWSGSPRLLTAPNQVEQERALEHLQQAGIGMCACMWTQLYLYAFHLWLVIWMYDICVHDYVCMCDCMLEWTVCMNTWLYKYFSVYKSHMPLLKKQSKGHEVHLDVMHECITYVPKSPVGHDITKRFWHCIESCIGVGPIANS